MCGWDEPLTRPGVNITCKYFFKLHGATEWVELTDDADGVTFVAKMPIDGKITFR